MSLNDKNYGLSEEFADALEKEWDRLVDSEPEYNRGNAFRELTTAILRMLSEW